jgi:hypothetical protein
VLSDLNPRDHQNFASCQKICCEEVLQGLKHVNDSNGTYIYLKILRSIIDAYYEKDTPFLRRIYLAWFAVFIVRIWLTWIQVTTKKELDDTLTTLTQHWDIPCRRSVTTKQQFFLTSPAVFSIELNAHTLTYLALLVIQQDLPKEVLNIDRFNFQTCESTFRAARSMSSPFSTIVNFTVSQFFDRATKLSALNSIKSSNAQQLAPTLRFPQHHKHARSSRASTASEIPSFSAGEIENIVRRAFNDATNLLEGVGIVDCLRKKKLSSFSAVNSFVQSYFQRNSTHDMMSQYDEEDDWVDEALDAVEIENADSGQFDEEEGIEEIHIAGSDLAVPGFSRMRVYERIRSQLKNSDFKIRINGTIKYLHKQTACWLLSEQKQTLSSDRTVRVQQSN